MLKIKNTHFHRTAAGFTIVELLVVIVVISILAAIATVAFTGIQNRAATSITKDSLTSAIKAMQLKHVETGSYGTTFPSTLKAGGGVGLALAETADNNKNFCINASHTKDATIRFYATQSGAIESGQCTGAVIVASIIGEYTSSTPVLPSLAGVGVGSGGGFEIRTNDDWTGMSVKWDAVANATKYELQYRSSPSAAWYWLRTSDGSGNSSTSGTTYNIPAGTTSYNWPTGGVKPGTVGETYEYRLRSTVGGVESGWHTASISPPASEALPTLTTLTVTANSSWTGMSISWSGDVSTVPSYYYEFQYRSDPGSAWYWVRKSDGTGNSSTSGTTSNVPAGTTSYTWPTSGTKPTTVGQTYDYRVRAVSGTIAGLASAWKTTTLSPPSNSTYQAPSSLTVTQVNNWTGVNVAWSNNDTLVPSYYYEFQYRSDPSSAWYWVRISDGSGNSSTSGTTSNVPAGTNSYSWPTGSVKPSGTGQTYEYRVRAVSSTLTGAYSDWRTASLCR